MLNSLISKNFKKSLVINNTTTRTRFFSISSLKMNSTGQLVFPIVSKSIVYSEYGDPSSVLKCHSYEINEPKDNEIIIKNLACPVNPSDINQIQGVYPSKPKLTTDLGTKEPSAVCGNEAVFEIIKLGKSVSGNDFKIGDWVLPAGVNFGTWRSFAVATPSDLLKISNDKISVNQAATIAVNPSSAYQMLTFYQKLQPGDWFIQNGGNSQVGKAAIQIGKKLGLNSISIVRDRSDLDSLKDELYKLGATKVITEEENASKQFGSTIKEWLDGKSITLALNCIGGSNCTNMVRKLGKDAILLTYGGMSMKPVSIPTSLFIFKDLTAKGFWITENIKKFPGSRPETIAKVLKLMESGDIIDSEYSSITFDPLTTTDEEFLEAFKNAYANSKSGKQLIRFESEYPSV